MIKCNTVSAIEKLLETSHYIGPIDCPEEVYRASPGVSQSDLKKFEMSPAKAVWEMEHPSKPSEAMQLGSAIHCALLEPDLFDEKYILKPKFDRRTKIGKQEAIDWEAANFGKSGLEQNEMDVINRLAARFYNDDYFGRFFKGGKKEASFWSKDSETGLIKRCRLDNYNDEMCFLVDLKTTMCAYPPIFERDIGKYKYHIQAAYYTDIVREVTSHGWPFVIVAVEKTKDCDISVHLISDAAICHGREMYKRYLRQYAHVKKTNIIGGYEKNINVWDLPKWADVNFENNFDF